MKESGYRREFDDYKYPSVEDTLNGQDPQELEKAKQKAMAEAIKLAEELKKKYGK